MEHQLRDLIPLRTAVNTFSFDEAAFLARQPKPHPLPPGFRPKVLDEEILTHPDHAYLAEEIAFYWGSIDDLPRGYGHCVLLDDRMVSWCYVQAVGAGAETIDVWTAAEHRRKGWGTIVGSSFIDRCLSEGHTPFWLCDQANEASRMLAERLGFEYQGDIFLIDIPFHPFEFYRDLATHFFLPNQAYQQAAEAFDRAFSVRPGEAEDHYRAALAWASAGNADRAWTQLRNAAECGWQDITAQDSEGAFAPLRRTGAWQTFVDRTGVRDR